MAMSSKTIWEVINVPLPSFEYENITASGQGKGSTKWANHSHTPMGVQLWDDFDDLIENEGRQSQNLSIKDNVDLEYSFSQLRSFDQIDKVSKEEDVTSNTRAILRAFGNQRDDLSGGVTFDIRNSEITANPDFIAMVRNDEALGVGDIEDYESPKKGERAAIRRKTLQIVRSLYRFPFETKPVWKFRFLDTITAHETLIAEWEVPGPFNFGLNRKGKRSLPKNWSAEKQKVFHLVRQVYGLMVSDNLRYGIFHMYERWIFCKRTESGDLFISRTFSRTDTSPSVFQAIKTLIGFEDYSLTGTKRHPNSAAKVKSSDKKPKKLFSKHLFSGNKDQQPTGTSDRRTGGRGQSKDAHGTNLAATLQACDCLMYDTSEYVQLFTVKSHPSILVKMQKNPLQHHVASEMANEAMIYDTLAKNESVQGVIPRFYDHSTHCGVAMTCMEQEMDDLDDIGLENVSDKLKQSAVHAVQLLSEVGLLHNDLELRNIVQSRSDPDKAKIIDFGRAVFTSDKNCLADQVERVKYLLGV